MSEKYVCQDCVEDSGLQEFVSRNHETVSCSYCGKPPAALLESVTEYMMSAIASEYGDLEDNLDVNGQLPDHCDIEGVFMEIGFGVQNEDLMSDIISFFGDRAFTLDKAKDFLFRVRLDAWDRFQELVKHERRYTFSTVGHENDPEMDAMVWSPRNLLDNVARTIDELSLIVPIDRAAEFWRVRVHSAGKTLEVPKDFTSPPRKAARYANRMSPAGVPMFYGADDFDTAVREVVDPDEVRDGLCACGIKFSRARDFLILDLTNIPERTSFFDDYDERKRMGIGFLSSFVHDLSKPIKKDGREHVEYVPSQVFTEHVRHGVKSASGEDIMGIKYRSSKNRKGCYVFFVEKAGCLPVDKTSNTVQFLQAVPNSLKSIALSK